MIQCYISVMVNCAYTTIITPQSTTFCFSVLQLSMVLFWLSCVHPLVVFLPKTFKLFGFLIFWFWAYFMKVITETRRADNMKFIFIPINSFFFLLMFLSNSLSYLRFTDSDYPLVSSNSSHQIN